MLVEEFYKKRMYMESKGELRQEGRGVGGVGAELGEQCLR